MTRRMAGLLHAPATDHGGSDIRSAFRRAVATATAGGAVDNLGSSSDDDDEDDDAGADDDGDEGDDDDDSAAEDEGDDSDEQEDESDDGAEGDDDDSESESGDEDAEGEDDTEGDDEGDTDDAEPDKKAAELLSEKEIKAIQRKHPNDPQAQIKAFQASYTKKTQELATERKQYKALLTYMPLVQAYETNPEQTVKRLARLNGLKIVDADGTADTTPAPKGKGKTTAAAADDSKELIEGILKDFKTDLGPELEYLSDALGPAMTKALTKLAEHTVGSRVKPLEDATAHLARGNAEAESDRVMEGFYRSHPDAKDEAFEEEMNKLAVMLVGEGDEIRPVPMSEQQFLEFLYDTVKSKRTASTSKETIEKEARRLMKKRLAKLSTARSGEPRRASSHVADDKIRRRPRGPVSIRDAFKAAKAGVTFDDDEDDE